MQELTAIQLINAFQAFISACQITIEMPREFNKKWLVFSHYLNIYPLHSMRLTEFSHKCMDPELEKQFIEENYLELKTNPKCKLKISQENSPRDDIIQVSQRQTNAPSNKTAHKHILHENNTLDYPQSYYISKIQTPSQTLSNSKHFSLNTFGNSKSQNSKQTSNQYKVEPSRKKIAIVEMGLGIQIAVKNIISSMKEGTQLMKRNIRELQSIQIKSHDDRQSLLNEPIKKMDSNQLKQKQVLIKEIVKKNFEKEKKNQKKEQSIDCTYGYLVNLKPVEIVTARNEKHQFKNNIQSNNQSQDSFNQNLKSMQNSIQNQNSCAILNQNTNGIKNSIYHSQSIAMLRLLEQAQSKKQLKIHSPQSHDTLFLSSRSSNANPLSKR